MGNEVDAVERVLDQYISLPEIDRYTFRRRFHIIEKYAERLAADRIGAREAADAAIPGGLTTVQVVSGPLAGALKRGRPRKTPVVAKVADDVLGLSAAPMRKRGRPPGTKNKPKANSGADTAPPMAIDPLLATGNQAS